MAIIKIPASNIYKYELLSKKNNRIDTIDAQFSIELKTGNILASSYSEEQTFYSYDENSGTFTCPSAKPNEIFSWEAVVVYPEGIEDPKDNKIYPIVAAKAYDEWGLSMSGQENVVPDISKMTFKVESKWGVVTTTGDNKGNYSTDDEEAEYSGSFAFELNMFPSYKLSLEREVQQGALANDKNYNFAIKTVKFDGDTTIEKYLLSRKFSVLGTYYVNETTKYNYQEKDPTSLVFTLPSNEWVQESTEFMGDPLADTLSDRILGNYEKGKEVYLIKCSVGNYYDVDGNINISIDAAGLPMMFQKYQRVEPYIFTSKGEVPLSKDENGNPKVFEIIGTDFSYNGVPWQELTIQEYSRQS